MQPMHFNAVALCKPQVLTKILISLALQLFIVLIDVKPKTKWLTFVIYTEFVAQIVTGLLSWNVLVFFSQLFVISEKLLPRWMFGLCWYLDRYLESTSHPVAEMASRSAFKFSMSGDTAFKLSGDTAFKLSGERAAAYKQRSDNLMISAFVLPTITQFGVCISKNGNE